MTERDYIILALIVYLPVTFFLSILAVIWFYRLRSLRTKYAAISDLEAYVDQKREEADAFFDKARAKIEALIQEKNIAYDKLARQEVELTKRISLTSQDYDEKYKKLRELEAALKPLEEAVHFAEDGFKIPRFELEDHAAYVVALKKNHEGQKELHRRRKAVFCRAEWQVSGSASEGKKMTDRIIRLTLRAFNNECDVLISKVNFKNGDNIKERIRKVADALDNLNQSLSVCIAQEFLQMKYEEVDLVCGEKYKKEEDRQRLREQKEAEREEQKAQREIQAEIRRQEAHERKKRAAIREIQERLLIASEEHRQALQAEIAAMEQELAQAVLDKGRLLSMAEHTRIGHLYVISNRGSFGEGVIKIGMTRRLEPMDRVKELGDASVPFPFDVHAMVFSEDAPALERELHREFEEQRINRVNNRKEFFRVPLEDVHRKIQSLMPEVPFEYAAGSADYLASIEMSHPVREEVASDAFPDHL